MKLGLSACLLGEKTRYDARDKLDPFLTGTLGRHVRFVPVCPEVDAAWVCRGSRCGWRSVAAGRGWSLSGPVVT